MKEGMLSSLCKRSLLVFALLSSLLSYAQNGQVAIQLHNAQIITSSNAATWLNDYAARANKIPIQVIVRFAALPSQEQQSIVQHNGLQILQYLSGNSYVALVLPSVSPGPVSAQVVSFTEVKPEWKMDNYLLEKTGTSGSIEVNATFAGGTVEKDIQTYVQNIGGSILPGNLQFLGIYKLSIPSNKLKGLASWYNVKYISPAPEDQPLNFESKNATKINLAALPVVFGGPGLTGAGVTIGVGDNTSGIVHIDLKDRIINYNPTPYTNHGVHINGIVGGAAIMDPKGEGMAPSATLVDHLYGAVWEQTPEMLQAHHMTLTNNSYASVIGNCKYAGTYDVNSQAVDEMSVRYKNVLHVFAAGNDGYLDCSPFPKGFATVNGGYQPAKNNIVVTSTDKRYVNASDGGRGPIKDGRLKPEITAVGVDVTSTTRSEEYLTAGGTSMACPEVTGALGLLSERYKQLNSNNDPRADVLKTLLLNGTMDIGNPGPDYRFGFGFMDLYRSLQMLENNRYLTGGAFTGSIQNMNITVPVNTSKLKVMLCWHDTPGNPVADTQLVNDLDLEVIDLSNTTHHPLILDPTPANINNNAQEGIDRLNNCEQVTINNPAPGNYSMVVRGFKVPAGIQDYVLAYDFVPEGVMLSYPVTGAKVKAKDSLRIYWDASDNTNSFTLEYSTDNGNNWNLISNAIPADQRFYVWYVPDNINSGKSQMRLTRNNTTQVYTTGVFAISLQPQVQLDTLQCPGYIRIKWDAIANADSYKLYRKIGPAMAEVGSTTATDYNFSGLSPDSFYYVAVSPVIDGTTGYRSSAMKRKPDNGSCAGHISDGDLRMEKMLSPVTGRRFTSTELKANQSLSVAIRNLDDAPVNYYRVSWNLNKAAWQSAVYNDPIPARGSIVLKLAEIDMSSVGAYDLQVTVENLLMSDPAKVNDSISKTIRQLNNDPISLTIQYTDGFESSPAFQSTVDSSGITPGDHWDYHNETDTGRIRSFVNTGITLDGNRSISMDTWKATPDNQNDLIGTFNLSGYNAANDEVRMEFDYLLHGRPKFIDGNVVSVRGNDQQEWQNIFYYNQQVIGKVQNTGSLSITDGLQEEGQNFSTSFQIKIGQHDSSVIASRNYGNGLTFDDIRIYTVQNDIQLLEVISPKPTECNAGPAVPLTINIRNSVNQTLSNVQLNYQLNNGPVVSETLASIAGKQTQVYTFNKKLDLSAPGDHVLNIWVSAQGDSYRKNDSILNYHIHNQPLVNIYPYFEDFEAGNGNWYSDGQNNSWEWGMPQSLKINKAASGTKVWKTNLDGNYNNNEFSYLYSPCFDISTLSNPVLTFQAAMDIENCGIILCDAGYMEYTTDGNNWLHLDDMHKGINWYNDTNYHIWTVEDLTGWQEVTTPLPKTNGIIRLRYVLTSDPGSTREGIAVDDIKIFDRPMLPGNQLVSISPNPTDGKINIVWAANPGTVMQIVMTDILGKEVFRTSLKAEETFNQSSIQTTRFYSGIYIMKLIIGDKTSEHKIVYR